MYEELVRKLRRTKSESKRKMLDEAADVIEQLSSDFALIDDANHDKDIEIEELKAKIKQQWISVEERLPKPLEKVLIYSKNGEIDTSFLTLEDERTMKYCFCGESLFGEVTHWIPLPEPPKEGENE